MARHSSRRPAREQTAAPLRRWTTLLTGVLLVAVAAAIAYGYHELSRPGRLPLRVIDVDGEFRHLSRAAVRDTVLATIDGGFFSCDMRKLRNAVLAMPWVADVSIRRVWPDRLQMTVIEQVPLARWGDGGLISVVGEVFRPQDSDAFSGLVLLHGPAGSEQRVVEFFQAAVAAVRQRDLQINTLQLDERREWWMRFDNGLSVSLGREAVQTRLAQFLRVYPSLAANQTRRPLRVDMRYAHGFAVRWQDDEAAIGKPRDDSRDRV